MFTSEFCEISKNTFFHREHLWWLFRDWFPLEFVLTYNISLLWREINSKHWISSRANQKKIKNSRNKYVMWTFLNFDQFWPTTISHWEFDYGLFTNLPRIIAACEHAPSSFKRALDKIRILTWQLLVIAIKLKIFLWIKLLENLLLTKYFIAAIECRWH